MDPSFDAVCAPNKSECIFVQPRRRAGEPKGRRRDAVLVSIEMLQPLFGYPLREAAKAMGIGDTAFKVCCRRLGIPRWPSRSQGLASLTSPYSAETVGDDNRSVNRVPNADPTPVATAANPAFGFWYVGEELQAQELFQKLSATYQQDNKPRCGWEFQQDLQQEPATASYSDVHANNLPVSDLQNLKDTPWRLYHPLMAVECRDIDHCHNESYLIDAPYASSLYGQLPWE